MTEEKPNPFNIIQHRGEPNKAEFEGVTITRQDALYAGEWGMIPCTPYDNHFIFALPHPWNKMEGWQHFCTCGSIASIIPPYGKDRMWRCNFYYSRLLETGHGYHQTTVINKDDFEDIAGKTIKLPEEGKKWLI